jgi:hypothetical protein
LLLLSCCFITAASHIQHDHDLGRPVHTIKSFAGEHCSPSSIHLLRRSLYLYPLIHRDKMLASEADRSSSPLLAQFLNTNRRRSKNLATVALGIALITFFLLWQSSSLDGYAVYVPATQQDDGSLVAHQEHDAANAVAHHDHEHHEEAPTPAAASSSAASAAPATAQTASGTSPITGHLIPPKIWQILLPQKAHTETAPVNPEQLQDTPSWLALNRDYL